MTVNLSSSSFGNFDFSSTLITVYSRKQYMEQLACKAVVAQCCVGCLTNRSQNTSPSVELHPEQHKYSVGFEDLTSVVIFWDITPCSPLKVNRRFGETCRLHPALLGYMRQARFLICYFRPWISRRHVPPKCRLTFNGLHGVIS
jgi:hypothetical protein